MLNTSAMLEQMLKDLEDKVGQQQAELTALRSASLEEPSQIVDSEDFHSAPIQPSDVRRISERFQTGPIVQSDVRMMNVQDVGGSGVTEVAEYIGGETPNLAEPHAEITYALGQQVAVLRSTGQWEQANVTGDLASVMPDKAQGYLEVTYASGLGKKLIHHSKLAELVRPQAELPLPSSAEMIFVTPRIDETHGEIAFALGQPVEVLRSTGQWEKATVTGDLASTMADKPAGYLEVTYVSGTGKKQIHQSMLAEVVRTQVETLYSLGQCVEVLRSTGAWEKAKVTGELFEVSATKPACYLELTYDSGAGKKQLHQTKLAEFVRPPQAARYDMDDDKVLMTSMAVSDTCAMAETNGPTVSTTWCEVGALPTEAPDAPLLPPGSPSRYKFPLTDEDESEFNTELKELYVEGKITLDEACPCDSGEKFKDCHFMHMGVGELRLEKQEGEDWSSESTDLIRIKSAFSFGDTLSAVRKSSSIDSSDYDRNVSSPVADDSNAFPQSLMSTQQASALITHEKVVDRASQKVEHATTPATQTSLKRITSAEYSQPKAAVPLRPLVSTIVPGPSGFSKTVSPYTTSASTVHRSSSSSLQLPIAMSPPATARVPTLSSAAMSSRGYTSQTGVCIGQPRVISSQVVSQTTHAPYAFSSSGLVGLQQPESTRFQSRSVTSIGSVLHPSHSSLKQGQVLSSVPMPVKTLIPTAQKGVMFREEGGKRPSENLREPPPSVISENAPLELPKSQKNDEAREVAPPAMERASPKRGR